ncbi:transcriptional regulator [Haliangium sp. UPWRP_2]|uniref:helix-turn-helix domain-containing transcriptional regulator n=1 Tax=Haliangium sp. UPWRP_2 TaxID=1931276 RepID=UPI000B54033D|nr:transcriptional regulator [Haliangium sp. UPWRP_2]PSM31475.1 putative addiction module antidote protein [Haliangium sp. UPWRP_2]
MNTIFIGGSRHISRLPSEVKKRIENVVASGHRVIVGDANGADKAVQKYLLDSQYQKVTVFCSGATPRNNLGSWRIHCVDAPKTAKGVHFYTVKDREMAREADFGLMIWDGKSPGTILNVLRLVQAGKISVLFNVHEKATINIKTTDQWRDFLSSCSLEVLADIKERATPEELALVEARPQASLLGALDAPSGMGSSFETAARAPVSDEAVTVLNRALASGDPTKVLEALGRMIRDQGMSHDAGRIPEFATIVKVLSAIGLRLEAKLLETVAERTPVQARNVG